MFHYAFKVKDIASTRKFYIDILGCEEGRSTENWIDFDFFGNQLSAHINANITAPDFCGKVDDISVPMPHFGCILSVEKFKEVQSNLQNANINFIIEPQLRYKGKTGEQWTMFVLDFSENAIEFKAFSNPADVFKT